MLSLPRYHQRIQPPLSFYRQRRCDGAGPIVLTVPSAVMCAARALVPHCSTRTPRWNLMLSAVHVVSSLWLAAAVVASPQLVEHPRELPPVPPSLPHEVRDAVLELVGLSINGAAVAPQPPPTATSQPTPPTPPTPTPITIVTTEAGRGGTNPGSRLRIQWGLQCRCRGQGRGTFESCCRSEVGGGRGSQVRVKVLPLQLHRAALGDRVDAKAGNAVGYDSGWLSGTASGAHELTSAAAAALPADTRFELEVAVRLPGSGVPIVAGSGQFQTALPPGPGGWGAAQWIGNFTQARAGFELRADSKVVQATAYGSGLGCFQLTINGSPAADSLMDPGWSTLPPMRLLYRAYDVTAMLVPGSNALGIRLGLCHYGTLAATASSALSCHPRFHIAVSQRPRLRLAYCALDQLRRSLSRVRIPIPLPTRTRPHPTSPHLTPLAPLAHPPPPPPHSARANSLSACTAMYG